MTETSLPEASSDGEYTFDVNISLPEWADRGIIQKRAQEGLGLPEEKIEQMMKTLASHRVLKVKTNVTRTEADSVALLFEEVGFRADISHSLTLKKMTAAESDGKQECPACESRIVPLADTQCPHCGVYIKKLTPEFLAKKRLMKAERERLAAMNELEQRERHAQELKEIERRLRKEIRKELEKEVDVAPAPQQESKKLPLVMPILAVLAIGAAFYGGQKLAFKNMQKSPTSASNTVASKDDDNVEKILQQTNQLQNDMARMAGSQADAGHLDQKDSLVPASDRPKGTQSPAAKQQITRGLVRLLAEIGQVERARDMVEKMIAEHATSIDLKLTAQLRTLQLEVKAWELVHRGVDKPQEQLAELSKMVSEIPDGAERALCAAKLATLLARHPELTLGSTDGLFQVAEDAYKEQKAGPRQAELGQALLQARGEAILQQAKARASRGMRQQIEGLAGQLDTLARMAPESSAGAIYGFNQQISKLAGNQEGAAKHLQTALTKARLAGTLAQQAASLSMIANAPGIYTNATWQQTLAALLTEAQSASPAEHAAVLYEVAQIHGRHGTENIVREMQKKISDLVKSDVSLLPLDEALRGLAEVALAAHAHSQSEPALIEQRLRAAATLTW